MKRKELAMIKKPIKKALSRQSKPINQEEQYWDTVYKKTQSLIVNTLKWALPLSDQSLDLEKDPDWNDLLAEYEINYSETELPDSQDLAQEIAYEYLLLVIKSLWWSLSKFPSYDPDHFEDLIE